MHWKTCCAWATGRISASTSGPCVTGEQGRSAEFGAGPSIIALSEAAGGLYEGSHEFGKSADPFSRPPSIDSGYSTTPEAASSFEAGWAPEGGNYEANAGSAENLRADRGAAFGVVRSLGPDGPRNTGRTTGRCRDAGRHHRRGLRIDFRAGGSVARLGSIPLAADPRRAPDPVGATHAGHDDTRGVECRGVHCRSWCWPRETGFLRTRDSPHYRGIRRRAARLQHVRLEAHSGRRAIRARHQ